MHRSPSLPSAAAIPAPDVPRGPLTRVPPAGSGRAPEGSGAAGSPEVIRYLTEDHDRIARRMNDVVVRRIFAAGLDLQAALGLIGNHSGATKIYHAIDELHHAIRDIRDTIFDRSPARHFRSCPRHAEAAFPGFALAQQRKLSHEGIPATR
jgi:phenylacetate-coenzyme A ligase PaaK-like adenylate-forming protein